jgi:hypothetical protein
MAGVINFILRKDYQGVLLSAYGTATQDGGGNQQQATLTAGYGDLKDRPLQCVPDEGYVAEGCWPDDVAMCAVQ